MRWIGGVAIWPDSPAQVAAESWSGKTPTRPRSVLSKLIRKAAHFVSLMMFKFKAAILLALGESLEGRTGQLLDLSFVGCPSGCGFSMTQQHVTVSPCPRPYHFYADPRGRVSCFQAPLSNSLDVAPPHRKPH